MTDVAKAFEEMLAKAKDFGEACCAVERAKLALKDAVNARARALHALSERYMTGLHVVRMDSENQAKLEKLEEYVERLTPEDDEPLEADPEAAGSGLSSTPNVRAGSEFDGEWTNPGPRPVRLVHP